MAARPFVLAALGTALAVVAPLPASAAIDTAGFYQMRCATCHGDTGQGTRNWGVPPTGPALKGNPFVVNGSPAAIRTVIRKGRAGQKRLYDDAFPNMPSFGAEALPDVDALVNYLKVDLQK